MEVKGERYGQFGQGEKKNESEREKETKKE